MVIIMAAERYEVNLTEWFNQNKKLRAVQPLAEVWNKGHDETLIKLIDL